MISRHTIDNLDYITNELDEFKSEITKTIEKFKSRPENTGLQILPMFDAAATAVLLNKSKEEVIKYLTLVKDCCVANFRLAINIRKEISVKISDLNLNLTVIDQPSFLNSESWMMGYYSSLILRDKEAIDNLRCVPIDVVKSSNVIEDEFSFRFCEFLQGLYNPEVNLGDLHIAAMEASDPKNLEPARLDYVLNIKVPELIVYRCIFSNEPEEFNESIENALESHKYFWSKDENGFDAEGWISLPLLAACVVAYGSKKFPIIVESDYLPLWLVKGEF